MPEHVQLQILLYNPVVQGWINFYGKYYKSSLYPVLHHLNRTLSKWVCRTLKRFKRRRRQARHWPGQVAMRNQKLFAHWRPVRPEVEKIGAV